MEKVQQKATKINKVLNSITQTRMQYSLQQLSALPYWFKPAVINGPAKHLLTQIGAQKRRGKDACMFFSLIYFFASFSIFYILHNYVIPQAMPHVIPFHAIRDSWHHTDISGYNFVHNPRKDRTGGGVGLYLADNFDFKCRPDLVFSCMVIEKL